MVRQGAAPGRPGSILNQELSGISLPTLAAEAIRVLDLGAAGRSFRPGQEIVTEGRRYRTVFLITEGVAMRYRILREGQRQIVNLLLPGDFAGITACRFDTAPFSVRTLTQVTACPIPLARLTGLFETQPRLGAKLFWALAADAAIIGEHLIAVGRRSAVQRVAHFLLELLTRLRQRGLAAELTFRLPLTQEIIGDALGLSVPYVNRVLQQLRNEGLLQIESQKILILNIEELAALADFKHDYLNPRPVADLLSDAG